ncbi:CD44 antigen isoform X1 [Tympanuchus pallidicinctus]|uniref:CD44 antigen isoform X1 n=1 Tax=Tympanuchus pallidicinctus TaxID=109042 RepID=UPI0022873FF6|nr:CD44 antigen isoform X1 [Tympanuchus pallidicinctus]
MANFYLWATFGLCLLKLCLTETQFNVSCRYGGVFHVEKNGRYSLTRTEAIELCRALNSTLATLEQFERAHELGFETCRYGFIVGHIVIPRINPYHLCAANHTGIYKLSANTTGRYDAYCYNATESRSKACEPVERIDTSFLSNQSEIVIDNEDGSRYNADGTRHSGDSSTSGVDDENLGSGSMHDTTPGDTSVRRSTPSYYGSVTPISHLPDHSSGGGEKDLHVKEYGYESSPTSTVILATAADFPIEDVQHPASTTVDSQHETLLDVSTQDYWKPSYTDEEERYPSSAGRALVTSETEKRQGPTQHPLLHSVHNGWISQGQNPANTTGATEQQEFTPPGENDTEKETSFTAMVSNHGAKQNDSAQDPLVYPDWGKEDYSTQSTIMDRVIPSRESNHEKESSNTALATPDDGAPHEDPTQPTLPSENEAARSTESITHSTDAPGGPVLLGLDPASTDEAGEESLLTSTITVSTDVFHPEEATSRPLAPSTQPGSESGQANATDGSHVSLIPGVFPDIDDHLNPLPTHLSTTLATSDDGAPHEDPTQPTLPSENEAARSTESITHSTDAPGGPVLLGLDPASTDKAGEESLLTSTITDSNDVLKPEDVTQEVWTPRVIDTALATPDDGAFHEDPTQPTLPSENEAARSTESITHSTDAPGGPVLLGLDPASTDEAVTVSTDVFHPEEATSRPLAPSTQPGSESGQTNATDGSHVSLIPGVFPDIDDHLYQLPTPRSPKSTSNIDSDQGPYKGDSESTPFPGESTTTTVRSQPSSAQVPEWLIIVAALLALALILAVCIAVNSRRRCGQKKKLVINNGKGAVEDRKTRELNGDASKSQEMVHLVHKEQSNDQTGACDEFLTIDETQNHEVDMKSGV